MSAALKTVPEPLLEAKVTAAGFRRVLARALLFAGIDDTLPMLRGAAVWLDGGRLWAAATDRFTLGVAHAPLWAPAASGPTSGPQAKPESAQPAPPSGSSGAPVLLDAPEVRRCLNLFRPQRWDASRPLTIAFDHTKAVPSADTPDVTVTDGDGTRFVFRTPGHRIPPFRELLDLERHDDVAGPMPDFAVNPRFMARFAAVHDLGENARARSAQMTIRRGATPNKPLMVAIGDDFLGLIMPIRLPAGEPFEPWGAALKLKAKP